jgi:polyhydroxybutyrate depolymerase
MKIKIFLLLTTMFSLVQQTAQTAYAQQTITKTMQFGGRERIYIVHTPPHYKPSSRLPCVLALHGGGGKAEQ